MTSVCYLCHAFPPRWSGFLGNLQHPFPSTVQKTEGLFCVCVCVCVCVCQCQSESDSMVTRLWARHSRFQVTAQAWGLPFHQTFTLTLGPTQVSCSVGTGKLHLVLRLRIRTYNTYPPPPIPSWAGQQQLYLTYVTQPYYAVYPLLWAICTATVPIKEMCTYCSEVSGSNLNPHHQFNWISKFSFLNLVLCGFKS
jgi:hypothetical protein